MSRIVVSGYYGSKNGGDEAILAAMIEVLSRLDPKLNMTVISSDPEDTARRHSVKAVDWLNFADIFAAIFKADLLLSGGGSLLQNVTSGRSLYYYMGIIFMAKLLRKPVMLYAQGIGPIYGGLARKLMRLLGNMVDLITVRDQGSLEELERLGITRTRIELSADPVLAIRPTDKAVGRKILAEHHADMTRPLVGISVREWRGWQHYKDVLGEVAQKITDEFEAQVVFLPMQYPEDVLTAKQIALSLKSPVIVLEGEFGTAQLLSLVGNFELMIGIRLHALIFAGVMGVPMVGISYDPKIDRFLGSLGEHSVGDLQNIATERVMQEVRRKWHKREEFCAVNRERLKDLRELAAQNASLALGILRKTQP